MTQTTTKTIDEILHALVVLGIASATIFVKNTDSRQHAASIIDLVNTTVLPLADAFLNPPPAPAVAAPVAQ